MQTIPIDIQRQAPRRDGRPPGPEFQLIEAGGNLAMTQALQQILIVEDDPAIRMVLRMLLECNGYRVFEAETAMRGEVEARTHKPDLVLVDLGLPDADGLELIRHLRSRSRVPIIVVSARTAQEQKALALRAGADDYITKPFAGLELLARIGVRLGKVGASGKEFLQSPCQ